jgi:hypothetical protein
VIERVFSADSLNKIVNDPSVYPWVCGAHDGPLDLSGVVADQKNVALVGEHGGVVFHQHQPGYYEAHTQMLPAGRGRWALRAVNEALHWMFTRTDAVEIVTRVPRGNLAALALTRAIHGVYEFTVPSGWVIAGETVPADIFALRIQDWMRTATGIVPRGEWFHHRLQSEYASFGVSEKPHADDPCHDRYVGAAVEMMLHGQSRKAVVFYNRWAVMSGYEPVEIITENPLTVDIRDAVLVVRNNNFWVMKCRLPLPLEQ